MPYIYIMTNPSFPQYVKIGYATDVNKRKAELNRSECIPFAFRVYATYEVESVLSDKKVHDIIDRLNPDLRAIENFEGKTRKREFYAMSPKTAFLILSAIAEINGREDHLKLWEISEEERIEEETAAEIEEEHVERLAPFSFDKVDIPVGEEIVFVCRENEKSGTKCKVVDNKNVEYEGEKWSLSALASAFTGKSSVAGPMYFKYKGRWLRDIRAEKEGRSSSISDSTWIIPCNPKKYDIFGAFEELSVIEWKQSTYIQEGDTVYIYVGGENKAIRFKCVAEETELYGIGDIDDRKFQKEVEEPKAYRHMKLRLIEKYDNDKYPYAELKKNGLSNVQGASRVNSDLLEFLQYK